MKEGNLIQEKSYAFSIRIVRLYQYLNESKKEYALANQLVRCGTSIGANIEEAIGGQSKADFISKLSIAYKETREVIYWLRLLHDTGYLTGEQFESMNSDAIELRRILNAILNTTKSSVKMHKGYT